MHIAFLTDEYPPLPHGGIGSSVRALGRALTAQGHRVSVVGVGRASEFRDDGVSVRMLNETRIPKLGWLLNPLRAQRVLRRLVIEEGVTIVEAPDWGGGSAGLSVGCPIVVRCHGSAVYFGHLLDEPVRSSVRVAERLALMNAAAVAAVSRFTAAKTAELFGLRQPIEVIPNGIDTSLFGPDGTEEAESNLLLYLGTLVPKKGVLDLCRAFSAVAARHPDARLRLVGRDVADRRTGRPMWTVCRQTLSRAARVRVEYVGPRPHAEVRQHIGRAAVCVFPSHAEAMPLSWLEAMACGRPLVAYRTAWAEEIVEDGQTGLLVPPGDVDGLADALLHLLEDEGLRLRLGQAARQRVEERFSSQIVASRTVDWYQRVLAGRRQ